MNIDNQKPTSVYTQNPFESISETIQLLELAFRLQDGFKNNLIDKSCFTKAITLDTGTGTSINSRPFDPEGLKLRFHNLVLVSMASVAIAVDTGLDKAFGAKYPELNDNTNSLRNFFYMLRCAFSHDISHPKWEVREKYQHVYKIIVPKEFMQMISNNKNAKEQSFEFDSKTLNGQTVSIGSFHGIDGLACLALYAAKLTENHKV